MLKTICVIGSSGFVGSHLVAYLHSKKIKNSSNYLLSNIYPDEPKANEVDTLLVKNNFLNKEKIYSVKRKNNLLKIVTYLYGNDGNDNNAYNNNGNNDKMITMTITIVTIATTSISIINHS